MVERIHKSTNHIFLCGPRVIAIEKFLTSVRLFPGGAGGIVVAEDKVD